MSGLSPERRAQLDDALIRVGYLEYVTKGEDPEWAVLVDDLLPNLAPLIAGWLAAEREAGAAEVRARVEALADLWAGSDPDREFILGDEYAADLRAALNGGE